MRVVYFGDSLVIPFDSISWVYYRERPGRSVPERSMPRALATPTSSATQATVYSELDVDVPADVKPPTARPRYPEALRADGIEGEVIAEWVVDTLGRPEVRSFRVIRSTHRYFAEAVREVLPRMRFLPAEKNGHKVRQIVRQPFSFTISR
jgi:protein TonB